MPYSLLTPVLAVIMGVLVLGDSMNLFKIAGSLLVIFGTAVAVINIRNLRMHARFPRFRRGGRPVRNRKKGHPLLR